MRGLADTPRGSAALDPNGHADTVMAATACSARPSLGGSSLSVSSR
jgi:hypothetical protein